MQRGWKRSVIVVLVLALCVRIGYVFAEPVGGPSGDGLHYLRLATYLGSTGRWSPQSWTVFALSHRQAHEYARSVNLVSPDAYWPPLFILMLAALMRVYWLFVNLGAHEIVTNGLIIWLRVSQQLLGTITVGIIGLIALRLFGKRVALIALVIAALFPPLVSLPQSMDSECLFIPLVLGSVLATLHYLRSGRISTLVIASALAALAALTRAEGLILMLPLLAIGLSRRNVTRGRESGPGIPAERPLRLGAARLLPAAAVLCSFAVLAAPWTIRNYIEFHHLVPALSLSGGKTLAGVYNPEAAGMPRPGWVSPRGDPSFWRIYYGSAANEWAQNSRLESAGVAYAGSHPLYVLRVVYWNVRRLLNIEAPSGAGGPNPGLPRSILVAGVLCSWVLEALALLGAFTASARRAPKWLWLFPGSIILAVVAVTVDYQRFQFPIDPFLIVLSALAVESIWRRRPGQDRESRTHDRARRRPRDSEYRIRSGGQRGLTAARA